MTHGEVMQSRLRDPVFRGFTPGGNSISVAPRASLSNDSRAERTAAPYYSFTLGGSVPCVTR